MTIIPERLEALDSLTLHHGKHDDFESGHCAMEVVAWLAGLGHTDAPACASPVLARYTIQLNDRWDTEKRQALRPYLPRMVGTGGDGKDEVRIRIATRFLCTDLLEPWLRLAGMDARADSLAALVDATPTEIRSTLYAIRDEAWKARDSLKAKVREELAKRGKPVADAAAVAVAAAVADAADAAASAAVAAAVADADAAADAAADAVAVADAVADAVAVAVADADAAAGGDYGSQYDAAYKAVRQYLRDNLLPVSERMRELGAQQEPLALVLLDRLIDANEASA